MSETVRRTLRKKEYNVNNSSMDKVMLGQHCLKAQVKEYKDFLG